jgi:hypothetical protein
VYIDDSWVASVSYREPTAEAMLSSVRVTTSGCVRKRDHRHDTECSEHDPDHVALDPNRTLISDPSASCIRPGIDPTTEFSSNPFQRQLESPAIAVFPGVRGASTVAVTVGFEPKEVLSARRSR